MRQNLAKQRLVRCDAYWVAMAGSRVDAPER
jgi:hypothetical protein